MKKEVLFFLLNEYADWEPAFVAASLNAGVKPGCEVHYVTKVVAVNNEPVVSLGGFRTLPDYTLDTMPGDYAALILVGGMQWHTEEAKKVIPAVEDAVKKHRILGAICNATLFLGTHGYLNGVKHTSNTLELLHKWAGENYTNDAGYLNRQAVSDGGIVTANGTGYLEFTRELLLALEADTPETIEEAYHFNKKGLCEFLGLR